MTTGRVEGLTHLGMGKLTDGTLVPRVLPGERVEVDGDSVRVLDPVADRVAPPCRHFKSCGGCSMQHASEDLVADWKVGIVRRACELRGLETDIGGLHTSPPRSRRRAKFAGRRTKNGALVGFHARGSDTVIAVPDCQLVTPGLLATLPALEALTIAAGTRKGELSFTVTETVTGPDVLIGADRDVPDTLRTDLAAIARDHGLSRLTWNDEPVAQRDPPALRFDGIAVEPPPGAFLQATEDGERALRAAVADIVGDAGRIVDLFAGCGTFALPLARTADVHAVEGDAALTAALDRGWRRAQGLKRVTTEARDLFRRPLEPDELRRFDAAVIDPPRAGAEAQVGRLAAAGPPRIAMVSCNPVTFARDAAALVEGGYRMGRILVVDQFRWSAHVELVCCFTRA